MRLRNYLFLAILFSIAFQKLSAHENCKESHLNKPDSCQTDARLFVGLVHQHQNFFHTPFSFQGIEAGMIHHHKLLLGVFGSTFITNLITPVANHNLYLNVWQAGCYTGQIYHEERRFHLGWLMNAGYFSLTGNYSNFSPFKATNPVVKVTGLVLLPEIYGELNVANWLKLRTGFGYSFYRFENQSWITKASMQDLCFTFGFLFGKFH
jgi:hypothetical protein